MTSPETDPPEISVEEQLVNTLHVEKQLVIPLIEAESHVASLDKTSAYIRDILARNNIFRIDGKEVVTSARFTEDHGRHIWVRLGQ